MSDGPPFPTIYMDILEVYINVPINLQEYLYSFNQVKREEVQEQDYLNEYLLKRAQKSLDLDDFNAQLGNIIKEHNDQHQFKLPKT
eukprot:13910737-Ditylum_brightwellii.AAC.1